MYNNIMYYKLHAKIIHLEKFTRFNVIQYDNTKIQSRNNILKQK